MNSSYSQTLETQKIDIVKAFFKHGVIKINTKEYFDLSSGLKLPLYLDHRLIFSFPKLRESIINAWTLLIKEKISEQLQGETLEKNTNIIFSGTATAGIAPAYALSSHSKCGFIYVRSKKKEYGLNAQIEGMSGEQNQYVVIDDMVVTGKSVLNNCHVLKDLYGLKSILCATSISCHESEKMRQTFEKNGIYYFSIFTTYEIFNIAHQTDVIDTETYQVIMECLKTFDKKS